MTSRYSETAFETVIESQLLASGYLAVDRNGFDRERAIFVDTAQTFAHQPRPKGHLKLDARRDAAGRTIALLKKRRSALIGAAVTGPLAVHPGPGSQGAPSC